MTPSIRIRVVLLAALSALAAGGIAGFAGWRAVGRAVEDRLVHGVVEDAAGLIGKLSLPLSDGMLRQMSSLLGGELVVLDPSGEGVASSLPPDQLNALLQDWQTNSMPGGTSVAGRPRIVGRSPLRTPEVQEAPPLALIFLVPQATVRRAKLEVATNVAGTTVAAILASTAVALLLSRSITAPLHRLAGDMMRISQRGLGRAGSEVAEAGAEIRHMPREVAVLRERFDLLLDSLAEAQNRLEQSAQLAALGKVAVSVAHELRNPLSGIRMNARTLADECRDANLAADEIQVIQQEIDRMDLYLEELMSLRPDARGGAEVSPADRAPVRLDEAATSILELLAPRCRHAGIEMQLDAEDNLPTVDGDFRRIRQVLMNLALNAMDAMPGGGNLTIQCGSTRERNRAFCRVRDTGPGVDEDQIHDIFNAFVTTKPHGAGLGLYISKRIVADHGGDLRVRNTANGAEFMIELPFSH